MKNLKGEFYNRNLWQSLLAYPASAFISLQAVEFFIENYGWNQKLLSLILIILIGGFPISLLWNWCHGEKGIQKFKPLEIATYILIGIITVVTSVIYWNSSPEQSSTPFSFMPAIDFDQFDINSVAVLPFKNLSSIDDQAYFTDGFHDELITGLAKLKNVKVLSRSSTEYYRNSNKSIIQIGQELKVSKIIEGSIQRFGDQLRFNIQLIDAIKDEHLWAESYDRTATASNLFQIQSDVTSQVCDQFNLLYCLKDEDLILTSNSDAYQNYMIGRRLRFHNHNDSTTKALSYFKSSIEMDKDFAEAYVKAAECIVILLNSSNDKSPALMREVENLLNRAFSLKSDLAEAFYVKGRYEYFKSGNLHLNPEYFIKALEIDPNNTSTYNVYGIWLRQEGHVEEAVAMHRKNYALDPISPQIRITLAYSLQAAGMFEESKDLIQLNLNEYPDHIQAHWALYQFERDISGRFDLASVAMENGAELMNYQYWHAGSRMNLMLNLMELDRAKEYREKYSNSEFVRDLEFLDSDLALYEGRFDSAASLYDSMFDKYPFKSLAVKSALRHFLNGNYSRTQEILEDYFPLLKKDGEDQMNRTYCNVIPMYAYCLLENGQSAQAHGLLQKALDMTNAMPRRGREGWNLSFEYTDIHVHAILGEESMALTKLEEAFDSGMIREWWLLPHFPWFEEYKDNTHFQSLFSALKTELQEQHEFLANN